MSYDLVRKSMETSTEEEFDRRAKSQAEYLKRQMDEAALDNRDHTIGLEVEVYAVETTGRLHRLLPDDFEISDRVTKELGLHNAEINTRPDVLDGDGLDSQLDQLTQLLETANDHLSDDDARLVLDSIWTIPPEEGSVAYLSEVEEYEDVTVAENMRENRRYYAIDNYYVDLVGSVEIDVPGVHRELPTILSESLATSIQPHLQVPRASELPAYYNTAIRTMAPVLALSTNSPYMPPDMYTEEITPRDTYHELRIWVFEQSVNVPGDEKVKFPGDIDAPGEVVDRVLDDTTYSPFLREWIEDDESIGEENYTDGFWEFEFKRGTYWRWLRTVIGGEAISESNDERSIRIEYRPLPTQPTPRENVGLLALVAGAVIGFVESDHPVRELPWERTRESFYSAARDGLDGEINWVDETGESTSDVDVVYRELFEYARDGLESSGLTRETVERFLEPLERRWRERLTPSEWKIQRVEREIEEGADFEDAVHEMQRDYLERCNGDDVVVDWR
ncbi:MAG: hypothetical protein ACLFMT_01485 [Halobacteriales archaeon]